MQKGDKLTYTNDSGESVEISYFSYLIPETFEEETKNNLATSKDANIDGYYLDNYTLDSKNVSINGIIHPKVDINVIRRQIIKTFSPKEEGRLRLASDSFAKDRILTCIPESVPTVQKTGDVFKFSIDLIAHSPFWEEEDRAEVIALLTPMMHFPLVIRQNAFIFGAKKSVKQTEVNNIGDVNTGFRMVFKARGTVENPIVKNAITGEYIKLNLTMGKDDKVEIINYPNKKKVTINSNINGFKYLDLNSRFFELEVGKNLVGYDAELNPINLDVILYYTPRYLGV